MVPNPVCGFVFPRQTVSPDENWLLYTKRYVAESELVLIDNFWQVEVATKRRFPAVESRMDFASLVSFYAFMHHLAIREVLFSQAAIQFNLP
jgi:hypothetical protein